LKFSVGGAYGGMVVTRYAVMDSATEGGLKRVLRIGMTKGAEV